MRVIVACARHVGCSRNRNIAAAAVVVVGCGGASCCGFPLRRERECVGDGLGGVLLRVGERMRRDEAEGLHVPAGQQRVHREEGRRLGGAVLEHDDGATRGGGRGRGGRGIVVVVLADEGSRRSSVSSELMMLLLVLLLL